MVHRDPSYGAVVDHGAFISDAHPGYMCRGGMSRVDQPYFAKGAAAGVVAGEEEQPKRPRKKQRVELNAGQVCSMQGEVPIFGAGRGGGGGGPAAPLVGGG